MSRGAPGESLNLRVSAGLKRQIEEHTAETGVSISAATPALLAAGLRAERRRR
ncbi:hypothetical protein MXD63_07985 [Frankia sp. Cpl3]|nr:hypothetical protein [Frankia sp. Cpl3]